MTDLIELAELAAEAAGDAETYDEMTADDLASMSLALKSAALTSGGLLRQRLGHDYERSRLQIARACDLPPKVLQRRVAECERAIAEDDLPTVPQHAAHCAFLMMHVAIVEAAIERKRLGAGLQ